MIGLTRSVPAVVIGLGGGSFQTKKAHVNDLIAFIAQTYRTATFPADELELVRKEAITALEESAKDPERSPSRHWSGISRITRVAMSAMCRQSPNTLLS